MIQIEQIRNYFPTQIRGNSSFDKYILKEYLQLMILDYLSSTPSIQEMAFIGGTNLRLVKGIDRFYEDLDFDCKNMSKDKFIEMTNGIIQFLKRSGLRVLFPLPRSFRWRIVQHENCRHVSPCKRT